MRKRRVGVPPVAGGDGDVLVGIAAALSVLGAAAVYERFVRPAAGFLAALINWPVLGLIRRSGDRPPRVTIVARRLDGHVLTFRLTGERDPYDVLKT
jgi:hypothetical protein